MIRGQIDPERRVGRSSSTDSGVSADHRNKNGEQPPTGIVTAYSLRVMLRVSSVVQISLLTGLAMPEPSTAVQSGPGALLA